MGSMLRGPFTGIVFLTAKNMIWTSFIKHVQLLKPLCINGFERILWRLFSENIVGRTPFKGIRFDFAFTYVLIDLESLTDERLNFNVNFGFTTLYFLLPYSVKPHAVTIKTDWLYFSRLTIAFHTFKRPKYRIYHVYY